MSLFFNFTEKSVRRVSFTFAAIVCIVSSCVKQEDIDKLQKQIDNLKSNDIASIQQQMSGIQLSLGNLQTVDTELRGYIRTLQDQESKLAQADEALEGSIASLKTELSGEISASKSDALAQLEAYKANVSSQLASLRASIDSLKSKDADLQTQITSLQSYIDGDLKTYIDNGDNSVKTWASASFATLEQYNTTAGIVAGIQGEISSINDRLSALEATTAGVTRKELDDAISALDSDHQTKLNKAVSDCNSAIETAKSEIISAYTSAISTAISSSESSMRTWVNNQLSGYYTIAQTDAKLASLKTNLEGQLTTQKTQLQTLISNLEASLELKIKNNADDIEECRDLIDKCNRLISENATAISDNAAAIAQLRTDLGTTKTEITTAYQQAINTAITTLDGQLRGEIATQVETVNSRIDDEVAAVNATIEALTARVTQCEKDIRNIKNTIYAMQQDIEDLQEQVAAILARIQSISFVPAYSDGKVPVNYTDNGTLTPGTATLDFELQPASTAAELVQVWQTALKMKAVYTITKAAPEVVQLTITSATADNGYLTVTVSGSALKEDFFRSRCSANAALTISDGNNELASEYVQLVPWTTDVISFGDPAFKTYCVENFDTDGDGEITEDEAKAVTAINASMLNITSLVGIEYFSNLESIDVSFNKLETLDLSHSPKLTEVLVNGNKLQTLNLSGLADIETLDCSNNKLTALNVSEAEGLLSLNCSNNNIGALNLKNNKALTELQCSNNQLTALDLKNNTALETLYCRKNGISVLDVTKLAALKNLDCSNNGLTSLNLYQNALLETLYCANNTLTSLGVAANTALTVLDCSGNSLSALDLGKNTALQTLSCSGNALTSLDVSRNAALESVDCRDNADLAKLWVKDATQQASLTVRKEDATQIAFNDGGIYIPDTNLKNYLLALFDDDEDGEISIVEAENVQNVNCSGRSISDLTGLQDCPNLKYLNFANNSVSTVELPNLTKLETVVAYDNPIDLINFNNDISLSAFYVMDVGTNAISGNEFKIMGFSQSESLSIYIAGTPFESLKITNSGVLKSLDVAGNIQLKWMIASNNPLLTSLDISSLSNLISTNVSGSGLTSYDVSQNAELQILKCNSNSLTSLNVDNNPKLQFLECADNHISVLRVSNNPLLETINASNNQLLNINVRNNTDLKILDVSGNAGITALALGYNTSLQTLNASDTGITDIDLSANQAIKTLNISGCSGITSLNLIANSALVSVNVTRTGISQLNLSTAHSLTSLFVENITYLNYNGCTITGALQIGTYLVIGNYAGVLISSNSIISTDEAFLTPSAASNWCANKEGDWRLPNENELRTLYKERASINSVISEFGGSVLHTEETTYKYLALTDDHNPYFVINLYTGETDRFSGSSANYYIRAVRAIPISL